MPVYVLATQYGKNDAVTIHGYTDSDVAAESWNNSADGNVTFTVDTSVAAKYDALKPDEY